MLKILVSPSQDRLLSTLSVGLLLMLSSGCLTSSVVWQAKERDRFATVQSVHGALYQDETVFVRVDIQRQGQKEVEPFVLRIPLNDGQWLGAHNHDRFYSGPSRRFPPLELTQAEGIPKNSISIPVHRIEMRALRSLDELTVVPDSVAQVYAVTYAPDPASRIEDDPMRRRKRPESRQLVLVYAADATRKPTTIIGLHQGTSRQWAWYGLTPLTAAADVVTFPLQLLVALLVPI